MSGDSLCEALFWSFAGLVGYTFLGYPVLLALASSLLGKKWGKAQPAVLPQVSVVIVARNEEARIGARISNLLDQSYPADLVNFVLVSDGSTDATAAKARVAAKRRELIIIELAEGQGKSAGLNAALELATGEIVVFADSRQEFDPDAIRHLVHNFSDHTVGAASGSLEIAKSAAAAGAGVGIYWKLEKMLRLWEARLDSSVGCTGAIYAIRRKLYSPIPPDTLLDDLVIPMQIVRTGHRVVFDPLARAFDPQMQNPALERVRKRRTLAGNFQCLFRYPGWFLPWGCRVWWQAISHKLLRLLAPLLLAAMPLLCLPLARYFPYDILLACQVIFIGVGALALSGDALKSRIFSIPGGFLFLNWMVIEGFFYYISGGWRRGWGAARDPATTENAR